MSVYYDVFNGDADGICALHQLRLANPRNSQLITGVKRDIKLLKRLQEVENTKITVLDVSLDANRTDLLSLLEKGNTIHYFDHHFAGEIPENPNLIAHIDTASDVCSSVLVDRYLDGRYRAWAVTAAFGDNLHKTAHRLAESLKVSSQQLDVLRELGELINYNGYGQEITDLHFPPSELFKAIQPFESPWEFFENSEILLKLKKGFEADMEKAKKQSCLTIENVGKVYTFPAEIWCKRVAGVYSNSMAREEPDLAHALMVKNFDGSYLISVRAPLNRPTGADVLCREFETGGGRQSAAGVNQLPESQVDLFLNRFKSIFSQSD